MSNSLTTISPNCCLRLRVQVLPFLHLMSAFCLFWDSKRCGILETSAEKQTGLRRGNELFFTVRIHHNHSVPSQIQSTKGSIYPPVPLLLSCTHFTYYPQHLAVCNCCFPFCSLGSTEIRSLTVLSRCWYKSVSEWVSLCLCLLLALRAFTKNQDLSTKC